MYLFFSILLIALLIVFYQDITSREINIFLVGGVWVASILYSLHTEPLLTLLRNMGLTLLFLTALLFILWTYFYLRHKISVVQFFNKYLGPGDVLFYAAISPLFAPVNYIMFFFLGHLVVVLGLFLYKMAFPVKNSIPLAGYLVVPLLFILIFDMMDHTIQLHDDFLLARFIYHWNLH